MRDVLSVITTAFLALAAWTATVNPSQADTGTVRVVFGAAGVVAGVGSGEGTLTFHGKTYPFPREGRSGGLSAASHDKTLSHVRACSQGEDNQPT